MKHNKKVVSLLTALSASLLFAHGALAAVSAEEAGKLRTTLTPLGGERAGNADGSIPAWTGGYTQADPAYKDGGKRGDPFANEKPLFTITAQNMAQYADNLSAGTQAMLRKYPDSYRLEVYPSHRSAAAPQSVYDATFANATSGKLVDGPAGLMPEGAAGGIPFPIPGSGAEAIWNHLLRWRGASWPARRPPSGARRGRPARASGSRCSVGRWRRRCGATASRSSATSAATGSGAASTRSRASATTTIRGSGRGSRRGW